MVFACTRLTSIVKILKKSKEVVEESNPQQRVLRRLFRYSFSDWKLILLGSFFLFIVSSAEVFVPLLTGRLLSSVAYKDPYPKFRTNLLLFVGAYFIGILFGGFRLWVFSVCVARLSIRLRTKLFQTYLQQEIGFFDTHESGKLLSRLNHDTEIMSTTVANNVSQCIGSVFKFIGIILVMFKLNAYLTLICIVGTPVILVVIKLSGNTSRRVSEKVQNLTADSSEVSEEAIQSIRTVRSFANENGEIKRYTSILQQAYGALVAQAGLASVQKWFVDMGSVGLSATILTYGAKLVRENRLPGSDMLSFIMCQLALGPILSDISQIYSSLKTAAGASESVFEYIDRSIEQKPSGDYKPDEFRGEIEFQDVTLTYPARPNEKAISNVSFRIEPGKTYAFVGPSGSGKSTCLNLLERFYDPNEGKVLIDGHEIQEYDHKYLHQKITLVGQEPILFNRTIRQNILYAMDENEDENQEKSEAAVVEQDAIVESAAKEADAHTFISGLVDGYNTPCGQRGTQLSGGQKQRVSIARAIIRKPNILLLDEATSALDPISERLIQESLVQNNQQKRTVLISAHRLSTFEKCDRIFVICKGKLVEQGSHEELMAIENGVYQELVRRQLTDLGDSQL
ncbi:unnamed protein product [Adineta ricciae]|uniref:Uncharacterized protein n=1 Tax=Adineta ricciae TaxID=249248 RepID=A0A816A5V9_ADIRI|nr:unnamed protein product [Adineta ricciae]CAF1591532.1 unnamed protein product [Adineta ricciae]